MWLRRTLLPMQQQGVDLKISGCGTARPSSALFSSELKVPTFDLGKHDYHALKVAVVKDGVFQEDVSAPVV